MWIGEAEMDEGNKSWFWSFLGLRICITKFGIHVSPFFHFISFLNPLYWHHDHFPPLLSHFGSITSQMYDHFVHCKKIIWTFPHVTSWSGSQLVVCWDHLYQKLASNSKFGQRNIQQPTLISISFPFKLPHSQAPSKETNFFSSLSE